MPKTFETLRVEIENKKAELSGISEEVRSTGEQKVGEIESAAQVQQEAIAQVEAKLTEICNPEIPFKNLSMLDLPISNNKNNKPSPIFNLPVKKSSTTRFETAAAEENRIRSEMDNVATQLEQRIQDTGQQTVDVLLQRGSETVQGLDSSLSRSTF